MDKTSENNDFQVLMNPNMSNTLSKLENNKFEYDILINNAGHTLDLKNPDSSFEEWEKIQHQRMKHCIENRLQHCAEEYSQRQALSVFLSILPLLKTHKMQLAIWKIFSLRRIMFELFLN